MSGDKDANLRQICDAYGITPVYREDKVDGSDVASITTDELLSAVVGAKLEAWKQAKELFRYVDDMDRLEHTQHDGLITPAWEYHTAGINHAISMIDYLSEPYEEATDDER